MKARWKYRAAAAALTFGLLSAVNAQAALINYASGDGANEMNSVSGANVNITPHAAWGDVGGGASWISYANTGAGGIIAPNAASRTRPDATALFTETLGFIDAISLNVLGDDTVTVDLVNLTTMTITNLFTAFAGQVNPCAPGGTGVPVGCVNADMGIVALGAIDPGNYELRFYAFQTNADVFGVQYSGQYNTVDSVPEPFGVGLLALGLLGIGGITRRRSTNR